MTSGEKIRIKRLERGYTQSVLAEMLDVSQSAITQFERNKGPLRYGTLEKIASALNCDVKELLPDWKDVDFFPEDNEGINDAEQHIAIKSLMESPMFSRYIYAFTGLNESGQKKAVEQVELIGRIPEFQKKRKYNNSGSRTEKEGV